MKKKLNKKVGYLLLSLLIVVYIVFSNVAIFDIINIPNNFYVSYEEVESANADKKFGRFVDLTISDKEVKTGQEKSEKIDVTFKLFGFIPIKKVKVKMLPEEEVYVGGVPIGLTLQVEGAMVVSDTIVDVENTTVSKNKFFKNGDLIKEINNVKIEKLDDIDQALKESEGNSVKVKYLRNGEDKSMNVDLIKNKNGDYKLGLWVRDDMSGIGTLTFVKKDTNEFGALGHAVTNGKSDGVMPMVDGEVFSCSLVNIEKGEKNDPGELRCVFVQKNRQGNITKNTNVGIFGTLDSDSTLIDQNRKALLGGRLSVKPGKAKLISNVSGITEEYNIEIIKANFQSKCDDKSLVIRVTDDRLLELTGGIVQGMSGSPIMQNGKVVGAVTHVFISDPTKGYGVYSDWMLEQLS